MIHQLPLEESVLENVLENIDTPIVVDLGGRLDGKFSVVHLTNIGVPFSIAPGASKERRFQAFDTFLKSKYVTRSEQMTQTLIRALSRVVGQDLLDFDDQLLDGEEIDEFVTTHKDYFDKIVEYLASMPNTLIEMHSDTKVSIVDPLVEAGVWVRKPDTGIGVNVRKLVGIEGFLELFSTWVETPDVVYEHSMLSNEHVAKMLLERKCHATQGLLYGLLTDPQVLLDQLPNEQLP